MVRLISHEFNVLWVLLLFCDFEKLLNCAVVRSNFFSQDWNEHTSKAIISHQFPLQGETIIDKLAYICD